MSRAHYHTPKPGRWLWKLAFLFAVGGGSVSYYLYTQIDSAEARTRFSQSLLVTLLGFGICVICATRNWWLRR